MGHVSTLKAQIAMAHHELLDKDVQLQHVMFFFFAKHKLQWRKTNYWIKTSNFNT